MWSKSDSSKKPGADRSSKLADASLALCAGTMIGAALLANPLASISAIATFVSPAAHASEIEPQAAITIEQSAPAWAERTVYFPESFPPVAGDVATPIDQF
jgi:hypothetical protein